MGGLIVGLVVAGCLTAAVPATGPNSRSALAERSCSGPMRPDVGPTPSTADRLFVKEQGFSLVGREVGRDKESDDGTQRNALGVQADPKQQGQGREVYSLGAVIANTSTRTAYQTEIMFELLATPGDALAWQSRTQTIPVINPRSQIPAGIEALVAPYARTEKVAFMSVNVLRTHWLDIDPKSSLAQKNIAAPFGKSVSVGNDGIRRVEVLQTDGSDRCDWFVGWIGAAVFRDDNWVIVGGASLALDRNLCNDRSGRSVRIWRMPPTTNLATSLFSTYCDAPRASDVSPP
jgi:hypothetical protein